MITADAADERLLIGFGEMDNFDAQIVAAPATHNFLPMLIFRCAFKRISNKANNLLLRGH